MILRPDRRTLLQSVLATATLGCGAPSARAAFASVSSRTARSLDELVPLLRRAPGDELHGVAARAIAAGVDRTSFLGAVFLAGVSEVSPARVGGPLHCVFLIESVFRLLEGAPEDEAWLLAFWALDDYRRNRDRDEDREAWSLHAAPPPLEGGEAKLRLELAVGIDEADSERAERALLGLLGLRDAATCFEALVPRTYGSFGDLGHRPIYAAQARRCLERIGMRHAETVLRALVLALAEGDTEQNRALFRRAGELAPRLPERWERARETPERSLALARELRLRTPHDLQTAVLELANGGVGPRTIEDALRLAAADLLLRRPERGRAFPVHSVTELESLCFAAARATSSAARGHLLLHAAGWLAAVREAIVGNNGAFDEGPFLGELLEHDVDGAAAPEALEAGLSERDPVRVAHALLARPELESTVIAGLRTGLARAGSQDHQHKLTAATLEQMERCDPRWRPLLLAPVVDYPPAPDAEPDETHARSLEAMRAAGLI